MALGLETKKSELKPLSTNKAVAEAAKDSNVDVVAAYPITPQTTVVERLAELIGEGELDAEIIHVESEHSALSAVIGASAMGARTFTATSSQGLALMHEILHIASGLRLPIVMSVAARALSAPISIFNDHSDIMNQRDTGWIIIFTSSAQEAYDTIIQAYKIAENSNVLLPVMVAYDGYVMSHTIEPVEVLGKKVAEEYIPKKVSWNRLDPDRPITIGTITSPDYYYEFKYAQAKALESSLQHILEADSEFKKKYGRGYGAVEGYMMEDAEIAVLGTSSYFSNLKYAVDELRKKGVKAGAIKLRVYRPFPREQLYELIKGLRALGVIDRSISYGMTPSGPIALDLMSTYRYKNIPPIQSFVAGIGQRRMLIEDFVRIYEILERRASSNSINEETLFYGVKGIDL
jgi:pyruvate ferredoxin oxidoreductase alpha subunit|uniref:2-oxoacid oxidoreductase (ferredoxin) n=1 Tax=Fervidicoccus fontis TaxID=683846 RepID=A0A7J3SL71_9CREN